MVWPRQTYSAELLAEFSQPLPASLATAVLKRKIEFAAGRYCAARAAGNPDLEIPIGPNRAPVWPPGLLGSITHTDGFASAAIVDDTQLRGLGIDSEVVMEKAAAEELEKEIATPADLAQLRSGRLSLPEQISLIFSAKESFFKCLYPTVKLFFGFHDAEITQLGETDRTFELQLLRELNKELPCGSKLMGRYEIADGYVHTAVEWLK